ncbi:MAG: hypothetical protein EOP09_05500 [Proteobacteria bacterium]|nr:MAG: hypothetical protein EOP09_05500 [Pseudomonadota bacterium]
MKQNAYDTNSQENRMNILKAKLRSTVFLSVFVLAGFSPTWSFANNSVSNLYQEGYEQGERNGTLITERVFDRTLGESGCPSLSQFEDALIRVNRAIKPPALDSGSERERVRGFFKGYSNAVKKALESARTSCGSRSFQTGTYVGSFYGSLLCQVSTQPEETVRSLEMSPLYENWSDPKSNAAQECRDEGIQELSRCGFEVGSAPQAFLQGLELGCMN